MPTEVEMASAVIAACDRGVKLIGSCGRATSRRLGAAFCSCPHWLGGTSPSRSQARLLTFVSPCVCVTKFVRQQARSVHCCAAYSRRSHALAFASEIAESCGDPKVKETGFEERLPCPCSVELKPDSSMMESGDDLVVCVRSFRLHSLLRAAKYPALLSESWHVLRGKP